MTWSTFHRRGDVLRVVIAAAESRRDAILPVDVEGVWAVFADERDLLGALQLSWHTRLMGRIDRHQTPQPGSIEDTVIFSWHRAFDALGGVRKVLDAARDSDSEQVRATMARATDKEHQLLAFAAGLGNADDAASARVGARIEERARETYGSDPADAEQGGVLPVAATAWDRMLGRLRSLAA